MSSSADRGRNIGAAEGLVRRAADAGARLVVLPEKWPFMHGPRLLEGAEPRRALGWRRPGPGRASWASRSSRGAWSSGSRGDARARNTSVLLRPDGTVAAVYRKLHMFDVDVGGVSYRESAATAPGDEVVVAEVLGRAVGMSVCYDLRFPELYRRLADGGAEIIVVPAAFTAVTGRDHWEPLLRARAIENQAFVVAAGQHGRHDDGTETHGRSMIIDPGGRPGAGARRRGLAVADLDFARMDEIRERLPALRHRRPDVYGRPWTCPRASPW